MRRTPSLRRRCAGLAIVAVVGALLPLVPGGTASASSPQVLPGRLVPVRTGSSSVPPGTVTPGTVAHPPAATRAAGQAARSGSPVSTWTISYNDTFTPAAKAPFAAAVAIWAGLVASSVPIRVDAVLHSLGDPTLLGQTGPTGFWRGTNDPSSYYPQALADQIAGYDRDPSQADISSEFNTDIGWYFGTDGQPGPGQYDFESVVLHELGHGLGFLGSSTAAGSTGQIGLTGGGITRYDRFVVTGAGRRADSLVTGSDAGTSLQTGYLGWAGAAGRSAFGGEWPALYAPDVFQPGSSYDHLDEDTYPEGDPNALMTPFLAPDEVVHDPGPITLGILADLGWATTPRTGAPRHGYRFTPLAPARVLDTRDGTGGGYRLGPGSSLWLHAAGAGGIPATGVAAVVLNVTAVMPTQGTFISGYPAGGPLPLTSNLNVRAGDIVAGLVTVQLSETGYLELYNSAGSVDLVADVAGYYSDAPSGLGFASVPPVRLLDTREAGGPVAGGQTRTVQVAGVAGLPPDVQAVVLNVTAVAPRTSTYVSAYPALTARRTFSNLNATVGVTTPNLTTVAVGSNGAVTLYNAAGSTDLLADVQGYYSPSVGGAFVPLPPRRLLDTRLTGPALGPGGTRTLDLAALGLPTTTTAVLANLTAVAPSTTSFVTAYPASSPLPVVSNLNPRQGVTVANLAVGALDPSHRLSLLNAQGTVQVLVDLAGYFVPAG